VIGSWIILMAAAFVTFLVDAGTAFSAADKANTYSSEAARAASIAVGPVPAADTAAALRAEAGARAYLGKAGVTNFDVSLVGPATVKVTVTVTENSPILSVSVSRSSTHTAQLQVGVTHGEGVS